MRVSSCVRVGRMILMGRGSEESAVMASQVACWRCAGRLTRRVMFAAVGRRFGECVLLWRSTVFLRINAAAIFSVSNKRRPRIVAAPNF